MNKHVYIPRTPDYVFWWDLTEYLPHQVLFEATPDNWHSAHQWCEERLGSIKGRAPRDRDTECLWLDPDVPWMYIATSKRVIFYFKTEDDAFHFKMDHC